MEVLMFKGLFSKVTSSIKKENTLTIDEVLDIRLPEGKKASIKFFVTGVRHENRGQIIKEFLHLNAINKGKPFLGMTDAQIKESSRTIYEYYYDNLNGPIELIPDPDNKFDKNAIRVMLDGKEVGYVPAADCERVHKFINSNDYDIWWQLRGGVSKAYPGYGTKVKSEHNEPGMQMKLFKK
jgi:hypothetical protein